MNKHQKLSGTRLDETWLGRRARRRKRDQQDASASIDVALINPSTNETKKSQDLDLQPSSLPIVEFNSGLGRTLQPTVLTTKLQRPTRPTIIIYATVQPETVIIPIVCSIIIFPIIVLSSICFLKHYNEKRRAKARFRAGFQQGARTLFTMGKIGATSTAASAPPKPKSEKCQQDSHSMKFHCMPELELETVFELEREGSESSVSLHHHHHHNGQPNLRIPGRGITGESESIVSNGQRSKNIDVANRPEPAGIESRQDEPRVSSSSREIVVTVEPQPNFGVVILLEDDESQFDLNNYKETAL